MNSFNTTEHFNLFKALSKLVTLGKISRDEMENLLTKSGLSRIDKNQYKDDSGNILTIGRETF
jgi:hypothetical protein